MTAATRRCWCCRSYCCCRWYWCCTSKGEEVSTPLGAPAPCTANAAAGGGANGGGATGDERAASLTAGLVERDGEREEPPLRLPGAAFSSQSCSCWNSRCCCCCCCSCTCS